jgi:GAF domain-containing protein
VAETDGPRPSRESKAAKWTRDVILGGITDAVRDLVRLGTVTLLAAVAAGASGLVLLLRRESVPAWLLPAAVAAGFVIAAIVLRGARRALVRVRNDVGTRDEQITQLTADLERARDASSGYAVTAAEREQAKLYEEHVVQTLDALQKVLVGEIPGVDLESFIERGIMGPARDMMRRVPGEDVRLSLLVEDAGVYRMRWGVGHRVESVPKFRLKVADSVARFAVEQDKIFVWQDLSEEPAYRPHPKADPARAISSMIAQPVRVGDTTVGVFNVVSTATNSFTEADIAYTKIIGSLISVVFSLLRDRSQTR